MVIARPVARDRFNASAARTGELGRVRIAVHVDALYAHYRVIEVARLLTVDENLRAAESGHGRIGEQRRDRQQVVFADGQGVQQVFTNSSDVRVCGNLSHLIALAFHSHLLLPGRDRQPDAQRLRRPGSHFQFQFDLLKAGRFGLEFVVAGRKIPETETAVLVGEYFPLLPCGSVADLHLGLGNGLTRGILDDSPEHQALLSETHSTKGRCNNNHTW